MSKTLQATCSAGVVKVGTIPLPDAVKLSKGIGASSGIAVIDEDKQYYLANTVPDLETTLDKLITVLGTIGDTLDKVVIVFNKHFTVFGPKLPATPVDPAATDILAITNAVLTITGPTGIVKDLQTLKGQLK